MRTSFAHRQAISFLFAVLPVQLACGGSGGNEAPNTISDGPGVSSPAPGAAPSSPGTPAPSDTGLGRAPSAPPAGSNEGGVPVNGGVTGNPPADGEDAAASPGATDPGATDPGPPLTEPEPPSGEEPVGDGETPAPGSSDPVDILRGFAPADPDLAEDYEGYITEEVGPLTVGSVGTGTERTITQTIFVPPGQVYDGRGETLTASGMGDGSQDEGQRPIFLLAPGASVKNVTITAPGVEGIHMMGDNVVENVVWLDVGEDAASVRSYFPGGDILITGGSARSATDKTFQFNVPCDVTIQNFTATDIGKLVRQNGGTTFPLRITLDTVTANDVRDVLVRSDSPECLVRHHNLVTDAESLFEGELQVEEF
ncbi:MAG TPA: pectate lyase [Polyangiaceae bacterium]|nr:pectate lyase [Polyangiaceae bacterium]